MQWSMEKTVIELLLHLNKFQLVHHSKLNHIHLIRERKNPLEIASRDSGTIEIVKDIFVMYLSRDALKKFLYKVHNQITCFNMRRFLLRKLKRVKEQRTAATFCHSPCIASYFRIFTFFFDVYCVSR